MNPMNHQAFLAFIMWQGVPNEMHVKRDPGQMIVTSDIADIGKFMTPSLRELKYTAPYMHNGMIKTLPEVVEFYNNGGGEDSRKDPALKKLGLNEQEKKDLVAFLEALSGDPLTGAEYVWKDAYPDEYPVIPNWSEARN
jgi:cytochrome c peroxidase